MKNSIKERVTIDAIRIPDVKTLEKYDLIVIGSPIYYERPLRTVLSFLEEQKEELRNKKLAVFVVCMAQSFGFLGKKYAQKRYIKSLTKKVSGKIIKKGVIKGWLKTQDSSQERRAQEWIKDTVRKAQR